MFCSRDRGAMVPSHRRWGIHMYLVTRRWVSKHILFILNLWSKNRLEWKTLTNFWKSLPNLPPELIWNPFIMFKTILNSLLFNPTWYWGGGTMYSLLGNRQYLPDEKIFGNRFFYFSYPFIWHILNQICLGENTQF